MGLTTFQGAQVRKADVAIAKNYLSEDESSTLNRIVVMFLDYAEDQAERRKQVFLDFVLSHYVDEGVQELDQAKLAPLLRLRYRSIPDATAELGRPEEIRKVFSDFQQYLYQEAV